MGLLSGLFNGVVDVVITPAALVVDVVTLDTDFEETSECLNNIKEDIKEILD